MAIPLTCSVSDAGDCSGRLWRLVRQGKALLNVAHLVCVLAGRRGVEADAGPPVLTVLLSLRAHIDSRAAGKAARGTADRGSDVPLALLRQPP